MFLLIQVPNNTFFIAHPPTFCLPIALFSAQSPDKSSLLPKRNHVSYPSEKLTRLIYIYIFKSILSIYNIHIYLYTSIQVQIYNHIYIDVLFIVLNRLWWRKMKYKVKGFRKSDKKNFFSENKSKVLKFNKIWRRF